MAKRRKNKKRTYTVFKRLHSSTGSITFKLLMLVIILGAIALVSGIIPKNQITPIDPNGPKYKPVTEGDTQNKNSLQLKTIKFEACSQTVAVEMVLDRSNSMNQAPGKLDNLKNASTFFLSKLTDDAPIGLVTFASDVREEYPIQPYKDIKTQLDTRIKTMTAGGSTNTNGALQRAKTALEIGIPKFPGRQFTLILVTDGEPTVGGDPTPAATEIKNLGVKIYTIGITQAVQNRAKMIQLMTAVSSPNSFFEAPDTTTLNDIYNKIGFEICNTAD